MRKCQLQMKHCKAKLCFCSPLFLGTWVDFELLRILRALTPVLSFISVTVLGLWKGGAWTCSYQEMVQTRMRHGTAESSEELPSLCAVVGRGISSGSG